MKALQLQQPYKLKEILAIAFNLNQDEIAFFDEIWLFNHKEINDKELNAESIVYLDKPVTISCEQKQIEHEDFFSKFVKENNLWSCYYGEQFVDVLSHYKNSISKLDIDLLIKGLNYYEQVDDFYEY